jgi:hypothetical protein
VRCHLSRRGRGGLTVVVEISSQCPANIECT